MKLNEYTQKPGPIGLAPYPNLLPSVLEGSVEITTVDPNNLFIPEKIELSNVSYSRLKIGDTEKEKLLAKFRLTNKDDYPIEITEITFPGLPSGTRSKIIQGNNALLEPGESQDIIIEIRGSTDGLPTELNAEVNYGYSGYTVSCKKNSGIKTIKLDGVPEDAQILPAYGLDLVEILEGGGELQLEFIADYQKSSKNVYLTLRNCPEGTVNATFNLKKIGNEEKILLEGQPLDCGKITKVGPLTLKGSYKATAKIDGKTKSVEFEAN